MLRACFIVFLGLVIVLPPAQAFWFFHHHKKNQDQTQTAPNSYPSGQTGQTMYYPPGQSGRHGRRLVPAYLYKNCPPNYSPDDNDHAGNISGGKAVLPYTISSPIQALKNQTVRIGIGLNLDKAKISVLDGAQLIDNSSGLVIANLPGQSQWLVSRQDNEIVMQPRAEYYDAIEKLAAACDGRMQSPAIEAAAYYPVVSDNNSLTDQDLNNLSTHNWPTNITTLNLPWQDDKTSYTLKTIGLLALNDRLYRGDFLIQCSKSGNLEKFNIINRLSLEDYLLSVVPSEMPSLWLLRLLRPKLLRRDHTQ